jgi:hypothetical protein
MLVPQSTMIHRFVELLFHTRKRQANVKHPKLSINQAFGQALVKQATSKRIDLVLIRNDSESCYF